MRRLASRLSLWSSSSLPPLIVTCQCAEHHFLKMEFFLAWWIVNSSFKKLRLLWKAGRQPLWKVFNTHPYPWFVTSTCHVHLFWQSTGICSPEGRSIPGHGFSIFTSSGKKEVRCVSISRGMVKQCMVPPCCTRGHSVQTDTEGTPGHVHWGDKLQVNCDGYFYVTPWSGWATQWFGQTPVQMLQWRCMINVQRSRL